METKEILKAFSVFGNDQPVPKEALSEAIQQREDVTPFLLDALDTAYEKVQTEGDEVCDDPAYDLSYYAIFLLAQFREQRAFPKLLQMLTLDEEAQDIVLGDSITEVMPHALYSTYNGDLAAVQVVITDKKLDPFARDAALRMMGGLIEDGRLSKADATAFLREQLSDLGSSDEEALFGAFLVKLIAHGDLYDLTEDVRQAYQKEKIELDYMGDFDNFFDDLYNKSRHDDCTHLIEDTAAELAHWACFQKETQPGKVTPDELLSWNVGRNDPCPCGSGKKFKKCCLPKQEALKLEFSRDDWEIEFHKYPPIFRQDGRPGLSEFYSRDAIGVDQLVYRGLCMLRHPTYQQRREQRKTRKEAEKLLWEAFEKFQKICVEKELDTPEAYDCQHKLHYLSREWLGELRALLEGAGGERYEAVRTVLSA